MVDVKFKAVIRVAQIGANVALRAQLTLFFLHDGLVLEKEHRAERRSASFIVTWTIKNSVSKCSFI